MGNDKGWTVGPGVSSGKSDIGNVLVDGYRDGQNHLIAAIGWDRGSGSAPRTTGSRLNQQTHSEVEPPRTEGDLRINLDVNGSTIQQCSGAQRWTIAGTWGPTVSCASVTQFEANAVPVNDYFGSPYAVDHDSNPNTPGRSRSTSSSS